MVCWPGIVVGDSRTGEADKIDGPYYFFKLIQKIRNSLPSWVPLIGIEGGRIVDWTPCFTPGPLDEFRRQDFDAVAIRLGIRHARLSQEDRSTRH